MKKLLSANIAAATILTAGVSAPVMAESGVTANIGLVSDYYFRGQNLGDAGAYAGIDYTVGGFYVGGWTIDDGAAGNDGMEVDLYWGYGMEHGDFAWNLGYTRYEYTYVSDFEHELNIGLSFADYALNIDVGEDDDDGADAVDYVHATAAWSGEVFGVLVGAYELDDDNDTTDYEYIELSAGGEVAGLDMAATIGTATKKDQDGYIVLDISKSFSL